MEAITNWATGSTQPGSSEREYRFSVGKKYEGKGGGFFYRNLDSIGQYGGDEQFQFSVAQLPDGLDELVREAQSVDKGLARSEERRVGTECVSTCRSRGSPDH